jgi:hypothetical protein
VVPLPPSPLRDKLYGVIDGTGVPMTARETAGREGKGEDGRARTREVKLAVFFTQDKVDGEVTSPAPKMILVTWLTLGFVTCKFCLTGDREWMRY